MKLVNRHRGQFKTLIPDDLDVFGDSGASIAQRMGEAPLARKYLLGLCHGWTPSRACIGAGVSFMKVAQWRKQSGTFAEIEKMSRNVGNDMIEEHAFVLAVEGIARKTVDRDGKVKTGERQYDTGLLVKLLAARKPDEFGTARVQNTHDHNHRIVGSPGESVLKQLEQDAELRTIEGEFEVVENQPAS